VEQWRQRDPILLCRDRLVSEFKLTEEQLVGIEDSCQSEVEAAVQAAQAAPEPTADQLARHVFAE
jgi:pyruvate dehydrogenase E1 component alpha subunit